MNDYESHVQTFLENLSNVNANLWDLCKCHFDDPITDTYVKELYPIVDIIDCIHDGIHKRTLDLKEQSNEPKYPNR